MSRDSLLVASAECCCCPEVVVEDSEVVTDAPVPPSDFLASSDDFVFVFSFLPWISDSVDPVCFFVA